MENPLRQSAQAFAVVTASGEEPSSPKPAALPAGPPSWLSESLPSASQAPPPNRSTTAPAIPPLPTTAQLPSTAGSGAANSGLATPAAPPKTNQPTAMFQVRLRRVYRRWECLSCCREVHHKAERPLYRCHRLRRRVQQLLVRHRLHCLRSQAPIPECLTLSAAPCPRRVFLPPVSPQPIPQQTTLRQ